MKCHKCGFVSFDYLSECRKCGVNLEGSRSLLGLMDFKPSMPFFLGAMIDAKPGGANGGSTGVASQTTVAMGLGEIDLGADLEFEVEEDAQPTVAQRTGASDFDMLPQIELPEGFSLSLGDEEKGDDLELVMGSDFEQALSIGIDAKEFEDLGQPAPVRDELSELQFTDPILDFSPAVSNEDRATAAIEPAIPDLSLNLSLEAEPGGELSGNGISQMDSGVSHSDDGMLIDFSENDLESLVLELGATSKDDQVGPSVTEQP